MDAEERARKKAEYTGPTYKDRIPRGDAGRPCKSCGRTLHWVKTNTGAWMPVEYDGVPHWGFCDDPGQFKKGKPKGNQGFIEGTTRRRG